MQRLLDLSKIVQAFRLGEKDFNIINAVKLFTIFNHQSSFSFVCVYNIIFVCFENMFATNGSEPFMQINVVCLENMFATNWSEPFMQINVLCLENMFATNGSEPLMQINQIIDLIL